MRLIDADKLKKYLKSLYTESKKFRDPGFTTTMGYLVTNICKDIDRQPTISTPHWIPVSERLPEDDRKVLCQTMTKKGAPGFVLGYFANERWCCGMNSNVVAWMPLPDPYKEEP